MIHQILRTIQLKIRKKKKENRNFNDTLTIFVSDGEELDFRE